MPIRGWKRDLAAMAVLAALALIFLWPQTLGGRSMLPADSVYAWAPWQAQAAELGVGVAHNSLLLDLYLQNYAWKTFIVDSLRAGQLPLWNPYILSGVPFLAAGQHSAMYPLSAIYYVLPLASAYGWFAALHLFLAGAFTYVLARTLRVGRAGSLIGGLAFMFGGFMVVSNVFPMIVASALWLPLILAMVERVVRRAEEGPSSPVSYLPALAVGAGALGMVLLAGHPEMYYYVALCTSAYALYRLAGLARRSRSWRRTGGVAAALMAMAAVGLGLGAAQWLPLLDLVRHNFREGSASFAEVLGWAYPPRHVLALLMPDFFGNPSHHAYLDLFTGLRTPVTANALGQPIDTITWGIKNYVEGACYVGILPLLLAAGAILGRAGRHKWFFAGLGALSLAFAFGSRLYWVVFQLPGLNQVHSPFRWVFPYSLCVGILAAMGVDALWRRGAPDGARWRRWAAWLAERALPVMALGGGGALLVALGASLLVKERVAALAERALQALARAPEAFADGRMFYSYEFRNLLILGLALLAAGLLLALRHRFRRPLAWGALAALVVFAELYVIGSGFLPRTDRRLVGQQPPSVAWLKEDADLFRITSYVGDSEKTFNANAGMLYGLQDVRGYDSIIPRQYVEYMELITPQSELPYNRIAPLFEWDADALDSRLLDLLNVKYVLTSPERAIDRPGYTLVYDGEMRIYRNEDALPRAFLVGRAEVIADAAARQEALRALEPLEKVILEEPPAGSYPVGAPDGTPGAVEAIDYSANEVFVTLTAERAALLVLGDAYFDGWVAYIRPAGQAGAEIDEQPLHIYRANGNLRAVEVPAGQHIVRFKYSPDPIKIGLYGSFMAGTLLLLAVGVWGWLRFARPGAEGGAGQRVAKNTVAPIVLTLLNKAIDMVFAMLMLRILGPADSGEYYFAVVFIGWFDILTNYGLNTLITRALARDRSQANRYLANATILRLGLCVAMVPVLALFFLLRGQTQSPIDPRTILAISLFGLALVPSNVAAGLSAAFIGYERMEIPALVSTLTTVFRVLLGSVVLLAGFGYVGLGLVSIVANIVTVVALYALVRALLFRPRMEFDVAFQRELLRESYPLMVNNLLATLFFKVAVFLLEWMAPDDRVVGWYGTAYKYIDAVGVIPAYFTMAIFPLMARYARDSSESLLRAYRLAIKLLVMVALPVATIGWGLADVLVAILGGPQYLPQSANILRVMIWYMPIGFINSVTQYVLIALNQQRYLTRAFAWGLAFSFGANLAFIHLAGFMASAYVMVAAELVLLIPFYLGVRRYLARIPWVAILWRLVISAVPLIGLPLVLPDAQRPLALFLGLLCYVVGLAVLGVFDREERQVLARALPARLRPRAAEQG
ncbi:MAG: oligosaccharide flippase family protein [Chloroflexi bacterium]|nr:oligosaccharide flippase family protein [Chloroflexota bacterium]